MHTRVKSLLMALLACSVLALSGCKQPGAQFYYRVFEVPRDTADSLAPPNRRNTIQGSVYSLAIVPRASIDRLPQDEGEEVGVLSKGVPRIARAVPSRQGWVSLNHAWVYSKLYGRNDLIIKGGGQGSGGVAVRRGGRGCEARIAYTVNHDVGVREPIASTIFYEGPIPPGQAITFIAPFVRTTGQPFAHVITFEINPSEPAPEN